MKNLPTLLFVAGFFATITSAMSQTPQISINPLNCLTDGSGTQGICSLSNIKRIELEVTFDPKGNDSLKSLGETAVNPTGTMPENYIVIRAVDNQGGANMLVKVGAYGAAQKDKKQIVYINLEILEEASVRQNKMQVFINQTKAQDLASGAASQTVVDEATQKNAEIMSALERMYVENRLGRFKISAEYHSTQSGAWNGTITSPEVTVDVVNKGSGFTALQSP